MTTYNRKVVNLNSAQGYKVLMRNKTTKELCTIAHYLDENRENKDSFGFMFFNNLKDAIGLYNLIGGDKCPFKDMEYAIYNVIGNNVIETGYSICNNNDMNVLLNSPQHIYNLIKERERNTLKSNRLILNSRIL